MFCIYCGKELEDSAKVCQHCGRPVVSDDVNEDKEQGSKKRFDRRLIGVLLCVFVVVFGVLLFVEMHGRKAKRYEAALDSYAEFYQDYVANQKNGKIVLDSEGQPYLFISYRIDDGNVNNILYRYDYRKKKTVQMEEWKNKVVNLHTDGIITVENNENDKWAYQIRNHELVEVAQYSFEQNEQFIMYINDAEKKIATPSGLDENMSFCISNEKDIKDMIQYLYGSTNMYTDIWKTRTYYSLTDEAFFGSLMIYSTRDGQTNNAELKQVIRMLKENPVYSAKDFYQFYMDEIYHNLYTGYVNIAYRDKEWLYDLNCINRFDSDEMQAFLVEMSEVDTDYIFINSIKGKEDFDDDTYAAWTEKIEYLIQRKTIKTDASKDNLTFLKEYEKWLSDGSFMTSYNNVLRFTSKESPLLGYWQGDRISMYAGYDTSNDKEGFIVYLYFADYIDLKGNGYWDFCVLHEYDGFTSKNSEDSIVFSSEESEITVCMTEEGKVNLTVDCSNEEDDEIKEFSLEKGAIDEKVAEQVAGKWKIRQSKVDFNFEITYDSNHNLNYRENDRNYKIAMYNGVDVVQFIDPIGYFEPGDQMAYNYLEVDAYSGEATIEAGLVGGGGSTDYECYRVGSDKAAFYEVIGAYETYVDERGFETYEFVYVDEDDIPELLVEDYYENGILLTYHDGEVDSYSVYTDRNGFLYDERGNNFWSDAVDADWSWSAKCHIEKGCVVEDQMAAAEYLEDVMYFVNDEKVSIEEYDEFLEGLRLQEENFEDIIYPRYESIWEAIDQITVDEYSIGGGDVRTFELKDNILTFQGNNVDVSYPLASKCMWQQGVAPSFGETSYEEVRDAVQSENRRKEEEGDDYIDAPSFSVFVKRGRVIKVIYYHL